VVDEKGGTSDNGAQVPGIAALTASTAQIESVSCASAGNCSAGGYYAERPPYSEAFVVNEANGTWRNAEEVPGISTLNFGFAFIDSVSCASPGNCSAVGSYMDRSGNVQAFVVNEHDGTWKKAAEVRGTATLNVGGGASTLQSPVMPRTAALLPGITQTALGTSNPSSSTSMTVSGDKPRKYPEWRL
jgi:hypothetical protein